ncbi:uncharacterized protein LOC125944379 [Dermacentor silvarum]|uniref:uncharacterized protein LOC125944379 n=1 Tax=Dermacentor silvarum TaxID=543639 RepID=UPI002100B4E7|nr:uncharacterized protein LOC125944379 [Dermacentor silvarum]
MTTRRSSFLATKTGPRDVLTAAALFSLALRAKSLLSVLLTRLSLSVGLSFGLHVRWLFFSVSLLAFLAALVLSEGPAAVLFACLIDTVMRIGQDDAVLMFDRQGFDFGLRRRSSDARVSISLDADRQERESILVPNEIEAQRRSSDFSTKDDKKMRKRRSSVVFVTALETQSRSSDSAYRPAKPYAQSTTTGHQPQESTTQRRASILKETSKFSEVTMLGPHMQLMFL